MNATLVAPETHGTVVLIDFAEAQDVAADHMRAGRWVRLVLTPLGWLVEWHQ